MISPFSGTQNGQKKQTTFGPTAQANTETEREL